MNESYIGVRGGKCTSFVGPDATRYFQAEALAAALRLYAKSKIMVTRGVTPTRMLALATSITGKKYKRGQYLTAATDVKTWADNMKMALPKVES